MSSEIPRKKQRFIKDPVHDQILLTPRMCEFIDSRAFQRLRHIKQLGTTYFVWSGASHNRFEHSIGVGHLARLLVTSLREQQPELGITDRDIECVTLAGLLHDLGHGPWSHVWDNTFIPSALPGEKWTHEEGSEMMLDFLIKDKNINISPEDVAFIKALIAGDPSKCLQDEKPYLFEIVANKRNGLDVDKFDYIQRDSNAIGDPIKLQIPRLIKSARVIDDQILYEYKDLDKVFEVYQTRHKLHKTWYHHKTATAIEFMIIDALLLAEPFLHIAEKIRKPEEFLHLTDNLKLQIQMSSDPNLAPAQEIFNRIDTRNLYRLVDKKWVTWGERDAYKQLITEERIFQNARELYDEVPETERNQLLDAGWNIDDLKVGDIIVEQTPIHYGMKEKNPLEYVQFHNEETGVRCKASDGSYSTLRPLVFAEVILRVFTKKREFHGIIQAGYRRIPDLDVSLTPGPSPGTVAVEIASDGQLTIGQMPQSAAAPTTIESDASMSPPATERGLPDDLFSTSDDPAESSSSRNLSRNASGLSVATLDEQHTPLSTAATAGSPSLAPTPGINASAKFSTPIALESPHIPAQRKPLSSKLSGPKITTENKFTTVELTYGSPIKLSLASKRDRSESEVNAGEGIMSPVKRTRSNSSRLPHDRDPSPSPRPKKRSK
ncbi:hypothetical protein GYMLUDRAFT_47095 [Collybiopsis luxurians FD-317 M1]|uniref:Unplaced genomic scaffold GYMLUscaffold_50, whole genome shotgun sequence n=1 Tax=Collybiopsis luxurians FD-317 M1 TaxID=944289 RepID=A0A0D0AZZ0_9AGAR|nr:hypothetical protein GYMLUDRAFT_47095 [Collybiopsis luxurians FD-317 M1]